MPETESPATDDAQDAAEVSGAAANGTPSDSGMGGFDWSSIGEWVEGGIDSISGVAFEAQATAAENPCEAVFVVNEWVRQIDVTMTNVGRMANKISTAGRNSVFTALANNGSGGSGYSGSRWLGQWFMDNGVWPIDLQGTVVALAFVNPAAAAALASAFNNGIQGMLPAPNQRPAANRSGSDKGFQLSAGAYLWAGTNKTPQQHIDNGTLRGNRVRQLWDAWREWERRHVYPTQFASWRAKLGAIVGGDANKWYVWVDGEGVSATSWLGSLVTREQDRQDMVDRYVEECTRRQLAGEQFARTGAEREFQSNLVLYALAALVIVITAGK